MDILTADIMKEWETRLTERQLDYAFELAHINGWSPSNNPPIWVWANFFREAEIKFPNA